MKKTCLLLLLVSTTLLAQTEGILPWVTNNELFRGRVIVNNLNDHEVDVFLVATRNNGQEQGTERTIPAYGQLAESSATLFPQLGDGPGYAVLVTCNADNVTSAFIIESQTGSSGSSPAQADVVSPNAAANNLIFNYQSATTTGGASAPVVVNVGSEDAQITFHAYQNGVEVGTSDSINLPSGRPFADIVTNLFPGVNGELYVIAESTQPLLGMAFIFNAFLEPSMANAAGIETIPFTNGPEVTTLIGQPVTGINHFMGAPILDFGGGVGTDGFPTIGAYDESGSLTQQLTAEMLDNPKDYLMAAGAGLTPDGADTFNNNITLDKIPVLTGFNGFLFTRIELPNIFEVAEITDPSISVPNEAITLEKWLEARGTLTIECMGQDRAKIDIKLWNLIPNRLYSIWGSFDGGSSLATVSVGGVPNVITTDINGNGRIQRDLNFCPTNQRAEDPRIFLIDVVLHSDHMVYGTLPTLSLPGKDAHAQLGFFFGGTPLQKTNYKKALTSKNSK